MRPKKIKSLSEDNFKDIESQLVGFWRENVWDILNCPLGKGVGRICFTGKSPLVNAELKYACWKKFESQEWSLQDSSNMSRLRYVLNWLANQTSQVTSISKIDLNKLEVLLRSQLVKEKRSVNTNQQFLCILRQLYKVIQNVQDTRSEYDKDVWDVRKLGISVGVGGKYCLSFTRINPDWLRQASKRFIKYELSIHSFGQCENHIKALNTFSSYLSRDKPIANPADINRKLIIDFLGYLASLGQSTQTRVHRIVCLKRFLKLCAREGWLDFAGKILIYREDIPKREKHQPRYIPQDVVNQLNQNLDGLPDNIMRMVLILQDCGMRISELLLMPFDCLIQDAQGDFFIRFSRGKMKEEGSLPVSQELAEVIKGQQQETKKVSDKNYIYLFPHPKWGHSKPVTLAMFSGAINRLAEQRNIIDSTGKRWHFQSHQFRHTLATSMINNNVPHHIVQKVLGHKGPEMTARYAYIHDQTLKREFSKFQDKVVDITGKVVELEGIAAAIAEGLDPNSIDAQWLKRNILAQALPNGFCTRPVIKGACPYGANKCLSSSDFKTDARYLAKHKEHLERTKEIVEWAKTTPGSRRSEEILKENLPIQENLELIISNLESDNAKSGES